MVELPLSLVIILAILAILAVFIIVFLIAKQIYEFNRELDYLDSEIERTEGKEQQKWIERRKRLWMSIIPFFKR